MTHRSSMPLIGITSCLKPRDELHFHSVGEKYVDAVVAGAEAIPVLIPALGQRLDLEALLDRLDGILVTGSPSTSIPLFMAARRRGRATSPTPTAMPPRCL